MKTSNLVYLGLALLALNAAAQAQTIYLCVDGEGRKELTDSARKGANCKPLDLPAPTIPGPSRDTGAKARAPAAVAPASFPRVDNDEQKKRDADRAGILNQELAAETKKLDELRKSFKDGQPDRGPDDVPIAKYAERVNNMRDSISRSEKNIEALKREINNIK